MTMQVAGPGRCPAGQYGDGVTTQVIVLNGGSSSGKSRLARSLQQVLPEPWLTFSIDSLIEAMPPSAKGSADGIAVAPDGAVPPAPSSA